MSLPETCPFCDAGVALDCNMRPQRSDVSVVYECRTAIVDAHDIHRWQSDRCENAQKARAVDRVRELAARVAEMEAREKQRAEDEAWANERTVLVGFQPVSSGWYASAPDGVVWINATAPTIHGALRALREKMEAKP